jgi:hypothetical protein
MSDAPTLLALLEDAVAFEEDRAEIMGVSVLGLLTHLQGFEEQRFGRVHHFDIVLVGT